MDSPDVMHLSEPVAALAPLKVMTDTTPTRFFNDSCAESELDYAIKRGATGATSNPVICVNVLKHEAHRWLPLAAELFRAQPIVHERDLAWQLYTAMGASAARVLRPVFSANDQTWGRLSIQTDPTLHHDASAMLRQSVALGALEPNMQVKMPATSAGLAMVEEATFLGVSVNVTVSFSVPQVIAIAEAVERGLVRREHAGLDTVHMAPVATMMIGRLDDWMKVVADRDCVAVDPAALDWAGLACAKRALDIFAERGFRTTLLAAAYRHLGHWTELVGGHIVLTMPYEWQVKANNSGHRPVLRSHLPIDSDIMSQLARVPDFVRAYEPNGMSVHEFDSFGPTLRTLRSFIAAWYQFVALVREVVLPDPDR